MKRAITVLLIIGAIGAGAGAYYIRRNGTEIQVNTSPVTRGDIVDTVGATGTLQAVTTVQVGSQVSGNIQFLGADFNSIVRKGQVIAKLDPSLFEAQLQQANANLLQARANLTKAQSDLERTKVQLLDAQQKYTRAKELTARSLLPQSDLDAAKTAVDSAQASLASQQATVAQAQAAVSQADASVHQNQVNLDHTIIEAPIDGIVTQRSVDVGQTVAASMQAPTLFIIAADLKKMQVNANIDEADVGRIRPNQRVTFRVDAYPTEEFQGTVEQIRLQPVVVQNVTTYGTVINVPNDDLKLKPGMTANVKIEIARRGDALRVPNASLRFRPTPEVFAALNQPVPSEIQFGGTRAGRQAGAGGAQASRGSTPVAAAAEPAAATATGNGPAATSSPVEPGRGSGRGAAGRGGSSGQGGGTDGDRSARMLERFNGLSAEEQKAFIERMKSRAQDTSAFEAALKKAAPPSKAASQPKPGGFETIDALFAPLPVIESTGRAWIYTSSKELKPVRLRLGITDGTTTELLSGELQPGMDLVTGVVGVGPARPSQGGAGAGNPLIPGGGRGPGGGGGGRGR